MTNRPMVGDRLSLPRVCGWRLLADAGFSPAFGGWLVEFISFRASYLGTAHGCAITASRNTFNNQCEKTTGQIERQAYAVAPAASPQTNVPHTSGSGLPRCQAV